MMLALAAVLVALGVWGGQYFMECDYVVYGVSGKSSWTSSAGYTTGQFWGLFLWCICLPAATMALMSFISNSYKSYSWRLEVKFLVYSVLLTTFICCAVISSTTMTDGLVGCLYELCLYSSTASDDFSAVIPTVGTLYFCVSMIFAGMVLLLCLRVGAELAGFVCPAASRGNSSSRLMDTDNVFKGETQPLISGTDAFERTGVSNFNPLASDDISRRRRRFLRTMSMVWMGGVFCFFIPLFVFESMAIGDTWQHFTVAGLQSYASSSVTQAYGTVWNLWVNSKLVLKLFPDVLIYWSFVYTIAIIAVLGRTTPKVRRFFHNPFVFCGRHLTWSNGEVFLAAAFFALLAGEGLYWYLDHGWHSTSTDEKTWQERFARTMGQLANCTMGLMILPVTRNGVFQKVFGVGWETMIVFHQRMAITFLGLVVLHMVYFWVVYYQNDDFSHDWPIAIPMDYNSDNFTIPLTTVSTWIMFVLMFGFSLEPVRRRAFELFYYSHHYFMVVWLVMLWHAASAWYYIVASISLWVLDRVIRYTKGLTAVSITNISYCGDVTRLSYKIESGGHGPWGGKPTAMRHDPGQYVFVNVPAISSFEWHPFTISSCPEDQETTHHIKDMGHGTFTGKLRNLASLEQKVAMSVDGPYGVPVQYERYQLLVLVAGGIGVTPCLSVIRHLNLRAQAGGLGDCLQEGVRLVWATRSMDHFVMFERELQEMAGEEGSTYGRFSLHLHLTSRPELPMESGAVSTCLPFVRGRPELESYVNGSLGKYGRGLVFACGPGSLVEDASRSARRAGMDFHSESFEL